MNYKKLKENNDFTSLEVRRHGRLTIQKRIGPQTGFTMVELIIAIIILSFGIISVYSAFSNMIMLSYNVSSRLTAVYLAKEGMEIVRNIRDDNFVNNKNWDKDIKSCDKGCQADYKAGTLAETSLNKLQQYDDNNFLSIDSDGFYSYGSGSATRFKRKITTTNEGKDALKFNVQVFWDYSGKPFSFETEGYLYDWY